MRTSVQSLDRFGHPGDLSNDSAETVFQSFLRETMNSSGMSHSLMLIVRQAFLLPTAAGCPEGWFGRGCHGA